MRRSRCFVRLLAQLNQVKDSGKLYNTMRYDKYDVDVDAGGMDGIGRTQ